MQRFWVWNNGTNKDRSGRLIWFDSSMAFCWYLNFFAPIWNVNSTVFSTEMQFSPSWFWLIKPDSWMFWCKSVIRGLWEGFEMKAKHLCSCSLCSCVPAGCNFTIFFFFLRRWICVLKFNIRHSWISLWKIDYPVVCICSCAWLQPTFLSQQKWVRPCLFFLGWKRYKIRSSGHKQDQNIHHIFGNEGNFALAWTEKTPAMCGENIHLWSKHGS